MNILILNNEYPPLGGGAGVISRYQAEGLAKLGHKVTVVTAWIEGEAERLETENLTVIKLKSKRKVVYESNPVEMLSWMFKAMSFLKQYCQEHSFDVSIAHYLLPAGNVSWYLKRKFNIPYTVVSHGHDVPFAFPKQMLKFHALTYFWLKQILKNATTFFVQSQEMKDRSDKFIGEKLASKNYRVPNGCNSDYFQPNYAIKSKKFKIVWVGRLVDQKDPFTFLKAIKIFSAKGIEFTVHILGDGPLRKKMEAFIQQNDLDKWVKMKGWVSKTEILEEYQSANLQVISSLFEGMSIAALESLSAGLYVLTTPVSGNPDVVVEGENGGFFDYGDVEGLAERLEDYYKNKFLKGHLPNQEKVNGFRKEYKWDNIVALYNQALKNLLQKNN
ncbi:MAG: glycosyltransferase family 4 protein [Chitinophagales bacterium]